MCSHFDKMIIVSKIHGQPSYITPRQGQTMPRGQTFDVNRNILSLQSFVTSFKQISFKSLFYTDFWMILYTCLAPADNPLGRNFDVNWNIISLPSFVTNFKKSLWSLILYTFLFILYMYIAPSQGQTTPGDKILMPTERPYHFAHLLHVLKNLFDCIHIFSCFYTCI